MAIAEMRPLMVQAHLTLGHCGSDSLRIPQGKILPVFYIHTIYITQRAFIIKATSKTCPPLRASVRRVRWTAP
jgi:hypothetical protein